MCTQKSLVNLGEVGKYSLDRGINLGGFGFSREEVLDSIYLRTELLCQWGKIMTQENEEA